MSNRPGPVDLHTRRVLMIAFQFPPFAMSSGVQRTLRFVQHLPAHGWSPIVLSAHPRAYSAVSADLLKEVPPDTVVERAFALDAARHLSIAGRYPGFLARPDRWRSWAAGRRTRGIAPDQAVSAAGHLVDLSDRHGPSDRLAPASRHGHSAGRRLSRPDGPGGLSRRPEDVAGF